MLFLGKTFLRPGGDRKKTEGVLSPDLRESSQKKDEGNLQVYRNSFWVKIGGGRERGAPY